MAREIMDLYDREGRPTGRTIERGQPVPAGYYRKTVHLGLFSPEGRLLCQKRAADKSIWPDLWDISVGGGVQAGESPEAAMSRELKEELGLEHDFSEERPVLIATYNDGFSWIYALVMEVQLSELRLEPVEVSAVAWLDQAEIETAIENGTFIEYAPGFIPLLFFRRNHPGVINDPLLFGKSRPGL